MSIILYIPGGVSKILYQGIVRQPSILWKYAFVNIFESNSLCSFCAFYSIYNVAYILSFNQIWHNLSSKTFVFLFCSSVIKSLIVLLI